MEGPRYNFESENKSHPILVFREWQGQYSQMWVTANGRCPIIQKVQGGRNWISKVFIISFSYFDSPPKQGGKCCFLAVSNSISSMIRKSVVEVLKMNKANHECQKWRRTSCSNHEASLLALLVADELQFASLDAPVFHPLFQLGAVPHLFDVALKLSHFP